MLCVLDFHSFPSSSCLSPSKSAYHHSNNNNLLPVHCSYLHTSLTRRYTYSTRARASLQCRLRLASCSFALAYPRAALPFHHFLARRQHFLPTCHSYLTITSQTRQSPLQHLLAVLTTVNRSPVDLYLIPYCTSRTAYSTFTDASQTSTRSSTKHTTTSRLFGNSTATETRMNVRSHNLLRALRP
jgi:hypothetical protein